MTASSTIVLTRTNQDAPDDELDDDGDKYVDCAYALSSWQGSGEVIGGLDCDDTDGFVYPTAVNIVMASSTIAMTDLFGRLCTC